MNCLSWNIRGVGDSLKISRVRKAKHVFKISFIAIQETMASDWKKINCSSFWDNSKFDCEGVNSAGRSGGLLCIWDCNSLSKLESRVNQNFLLISCRVVGTSTTINFVNIYSPQDIAGKRSLWNRLLELINTMDGEWILMGDFNEVRSADERLNSTFCPSNARAFNEFIAMAGLIEYAMRGRKFTYMSKNGAKRSKIDRFMVCGAFMNRYPNASLLALPNLTNDHCPLILDVQSMDYGPIPFKMFNSWLDMDGFNDIVLRARASDTNEHFRDKILANKLQMVKEPIKSWKVQSGKSSIKSRKML
jgi:exonuclease III